MTYREHAVSAALGPAVEAIWTLEAVAGTPTGPDQPVVPDGRSEIIVHFGDRFARVDRGVATLQPRILVAGQLEAPLILRPTGRVSVLGVRLRPAGAAAFVAGPQHALVGLTEDASAVSSRLASRLSELADASRSPDDAARRIGRLLEGLVDVDRIDARVTRAVDLIEGAPGRRSVAEIAGGVGLTRRQLERLFREQVGLTPKRFIRIRRLARALSALDLEPAGRRGTMAAQAGGYADQAHFVRDCREIAGYTPGAHLLRRAAWTMLFMPGQPGGVCDGSADDSVDG